MKTTSQLVNINLLHDEQLTIGQRIADKVAAIMGSWPFIIVQSVVLAAWIVLNCTAFINRWDPYPFILLNLALSFQAAYAAPFILISQNRQSERDRLKADQDYLVDMKAEQEVREMLDRNAKLLVLIQAQEQREILFLQRLEELQTLHFAYHAKLDQLIQRFQEDHDHGKVDG